MYQIHKKICSETFHPLVQMQLTKRHKNSIFTFVIRLGGVAQLVERLNGIQEVRGSTPLISTTYKKTNPILSGSFSFRGLCTAMPCHLRREPLRAGAAFMRYSGVPKRYFCTFGEKEHTSKRVSIIACDNVISKAKCATHLPEGKPTIIAFRAFS